MFYTPGSYAYRLRERRRGGVRERGGGQWERESERWGETEKEVKMEGKELGLET